VQKTNRDYWDSVWTGDHATEALDPTSKAVVRHYDRALHRILQTALSIGGETPKTLLELGCGGSLFLPYFARYHGLTVSGLDYSPAGCQAARQQLNRLSVAGNVVEGDIFAPPPELLHQFDVVFSMGVFEHFTDTAAIVRAGAQFLRPGGRMITLVPNMNGLPGWLQKTLHPALFEMHVPLTAEALSAAHAQAGLSVLQSQYVMTCNPYVVQSRSPSSPFGIAYRVARGLAARLLWGIEDAIGRSYPNAITSPYVLCLARADKS
jgi:2-polyprenyl-3-methyl-5-hydroxy-6-metoxy-1,4-benzoquinol methylase